MASPNLCQLTLCWFIATCSITSVSHAKSDIKYTPCVQIDSCRVHSSAGTKFFKSDSFPDALREFNNAYAEQPDPRLLLNIGRTLHMLGKPQEALKYYQRCQEATTQDESLDRELSARLKDYMSQAQEVIAVSPSSPVATPITLAPNPEILPSTSIQPMQPLPQSAEPTNASAPLACKEAKVPLYKQKWLWAVVASSAAGIGVGLGIGFGLAAKNTGMNSGSPVPSDAKTYTPTF